MVDDENSKQLLRVTALYLSKRDIKEKIDKKTDEIIRKMDVTFTDGRGVTLKLQYEAGTKMFERLEKLNLRKDKINILIAPEETRESIDQLFSQLKLELRQFDDDEE